MVTNRHSLSRTIPAEVKRLVRQKCGFGCIFCGNWLYEYEHIDPEFKDARLHNPTKICLLCRDHHGKVTLGRLSKEQVTDQYKHPLALSHGYANDYLDLHNRIHVVMGRIFFHEPTSILNVDGTNLLSLRFDEVEEKVLLNAKFHDNTGKLVLAIIDNEIFAYSDNWDIQQVGTRTIIRKGRGSIALQLNISPPDIIEIERIHMVYGPAEIYADSEIGEIYIKSGNGAFVDLPNGQIITHGISIDTNKIVFDKALYMSALPGIPMNKMDYRAYIDTGTIHSLPTQA